MQVTCEKCNYEWGYKGRMTIYVCCPNCRRIMKLPKKEEIPIIPCEFCGNPATENAWTAESPKDEPHKIKICGDCLEKSKEKRE